MEDDTAKAPPSLREHWFPLLFPMQPPTDLAGGVDVGGESHLLTFRNVTPVAALGGQHLLLGLRLT